MDNAIHACDALGPEAEKSIEFTARMQGPLAGIPVPEHGGAGPARLTRKQPELTRAHGWGLEHSGNASPGNIRGKPMPQSGDGWVQVLLWLIPGSSQKAG